MRKMCDGHHRGFRFAFGPGMMHEMCSCGCIESSKETRIKQLEAFKSKLEDHLKHIEETIKDLEEKE